MRNEIPPALIALSKEIPLVFLTGDLGFMALEPLKEGLGDRFINAGVAEQNMLSVAAGLAYSGQQAWVYSIAPFCYARPFEQIRNDVCLNKLSVKLIGNGGGYAYGSMGGTHHALEDYGVLLTLNPFLIFVPAFSEDVLPIIFKMGRSSEPCYLRLGKSELPKGMMVDSYSAWRCVLPGEGALILCMGPLVGELMASLRNYPIETRPELWLVTEMPLSWETIPEAFLKKLSKSKKLGIVEEHVAQGGLAHHLIYVLIKNNISLPAVFHAHAKGYPSQTYGSQQFHRRECGLDASTILEDFL